ncbi:Zinc finger, C2H2 [Penicillium griseofulvum]|uniref:Zinc finger, C2H2 n=1 Tax=Penicillium patulum TaxID=5078 RepID=A0A135LX08_PENPA|nr:Zinc finger, C2H2 [Penicillium griseofulvum]KXG53500.1 Zinc finger, C2H2 [Penicillium griseofulvum]
MAMKRKASVEGLITPKRHQKQNVLDNSDMIYEETHSDAEYSAPGTPSVMSEDMDGSPATPFSATSSRQRYPSELKTLCCTFEGCDKAFNRPARLQEHIRSHNNERIFKCEFEGCDKTFLRPTHLQHHVKSAHTGVRDYVCDYPGCEKSFVNGARLRRHVATHDGHDKYRCTEYPPCNETFRKHSTLQKHITVVHLGEKPFPCPYVDPTTNEKCKMAFDKAGNLRTHQSRVHSEKRFTCAECAEKMETKSSDMGDDNASQDVSFPSYASLQSHIRIVHPPKCPECPLVCSTARGLRRHLEIAHGNVTLEERKIFPCTVPGCGRSFTKQGNLTVHVRTVHDGEKRFVCGETDLSTSKKVDGWDGVGCGKRYGNKLTLEDHIRTAHLGLPNARKRRQEKLSKKPAQNTVSTLSALTGQGYAEETGRQIACFFAESCPHRFHRNYDLWVHMTTKHHCNEDEVQNLFMQRALLTDESGPGGNSNSLGIYGLGYDQDGQFYHQQSYTAGDHSSDIAFGSQSNDSSYLPTQPGLDSDYLMHDFPASAAGDIDSMIPSHNQMALVDPVDGYHAMEQ